MTTQPGFDPDDPDEPDEPDDPERSEHYEGSRAGETDAEYDGPTAEPDGPGTPHSGDPVVDEQVWAELVAAYHSSEAAPIGRWSAAEDLDEAKTEHGDDGTADGPANTDDAADSADSANPGAREEPLAGVPASGSASRAGHSDRSGTATLPEPDDDRFVPPPPPQMPRTNRRGLLGWVSLTAVPIVSVVRLATDVYVPNWFLVVAIGVSTMGFLILVSQPRSNSPDDGDNGAIV